MIPEFGARVSDAGSEGRVPQPGRLALPVLLGASGTFGVFSGTFAVLLADLSRALFVGAAASILAMALLGWTADRLGRRVFLMISGGRSGSPRSWAARGSQSSTARWPSDAWGPPSS